MLKAFFLLPFVFLLVDFFILEMWLFSCAHMQAGYKWSLSIFRSKLLSVTPFTLMQQMINRFFLIVVFFNSAVDIHWCIYTESKLERHYLSRLFCYQEQQETGTVLTLLQYANANCCNSNSCNNSNNKSLKWLVIVRTIIIIKIINNNIDNNSNPQVDKRLNNILGSDYCVYTKR